MVILGCLCIARGVLGAEQPKPFQWALAMQLPGKPVEVAGLYVDKTTCDVDARMPPKAPDGTVFKCVRFASSNNRK